MKKTQICRLYLCKQLVMSVMPVCHKALQPIDIIESPIQLNQCRMLPCDAFFGCTAAPCGPLPTARSQGYCFCHRYLVPKGVHGWK
nr:hypothetical protein GZ18F2_28 [uncultured archaeon GZfos18F2]